MEQEETSGMRLLRHLNDTNFPLTIDEIRNLEALRKDYTDEDLKKIFTCIASKGGFKTTTLPLTGSDMEIINSLEEFKYFIYEENIFDDELDRPQLTILALEEFLYELEELKKTLQTDE